MIQSVCWRLVSIPLREAATTLHWSIDSADAVLVCVTDSDGVQGSGYLHCVGRDSARLLAAAVEYGVPAIIGQEPADLARVRDRLNKAFNFFGPSGVVAFAISVFDLALHDTVLKRERRTLAAHVGQRRDRVPAYWSGFFRGQSAKDLGRELDGAARRGFRAFKVRVGDPEVRRDVERVRAIVEGAPESSRLLLEASQSWPSPRTALEAIEKLAVFDPVWIEDPLEHADLEGLAEVCRHSAVPVAAGEYAYHVDGARRVLDAGVGQLLIDLGRIGGVTGWHAASGLAKAAAVPVAPHVCTNISLHLSSGLEQPDAWVECLPWWDALFSTTLDLRDGAIDVPAEPGIGISWDDAAVERYAVTPWLECSST